MEAITLVKEAIHRPDEPRHFMEYTYPEARYVARVGDQIVADSTAVLKLSEVGYHIYDPVIYFPLDDLNLDVLKATSKTSHCPLKGDTNYYDLAASNMRAEAVGWCYSAPLDFAKTLAGYAAFDPAQVNVTLGD
jgi:uncharacterized protein (DUF427 family)